MVEEVSFIPTGYISRTDKGCKGSFRYFIKLFMDKEDTFLLNRELKDVITGKHGYIDIYIIRPKVGLYKSGTVTKSFSGRSILFQIDEHKHYVSVGSITKFLKKKKDFATLYQRVG